MALSKETRIKIFIGIDLAFFLLEIIVGYTAHSLALVADAFHMLNDVISLCVGLWAVKVATTKGSSNEMTYGWARAEILGGLVNGVFLVALCLSIFLQAIERFFEPQEVSNPKLVLIVGGVGLAFNILGLFVFHQHSHDHGHDHDHGEADELNAAESGHAHDHAHQHGAPKHKHVDETSADSGSSGATKVSGITWDIPTKPQNGDASSRGRLDRLSTSSARRTGSISSRIEDLPISPRVYRDDIISKARMQGEDLEDENSVVDEDYEEGTDRSDARTDERPTEETPLINHSGHGHNQPRKKAKSGGHSHADMNIRGMFLHVLGDALGNVGVMATALIIWLAAPWKPRFYFDPAISLLITAIILKTAIPLCIETAKPLLQAVPEDISVEDVAKDIESLPGIKKCRHLHVWALTPMKRIATLDVVMDFGYDAKRYTGLIKEIKTCLHAYGLHNSTVQPQFLDTPAIGSLECGDGQEPDLKCCTPVEGDLKSSLPDPSQGHDHSS